MPSNPNLTNKLYIVFATFAIVSGLFFYRQNSNNHEKERQQFISLIDSTPYLQVQVEEAGGEIDSVRNLVLDSMTISVAPKIGYFTHLDTLTLRLTNEKDLSKIGNSQSLRSLILDRNHKFAALTGIERLPALKHLNIYETADTFSLIGIDQLPALEALDLEFAKVKTIDVSKKPLHIQHLLLHSTDMKTLKGIDKFPELTTLILDYDEQLTGAEGIESLTHLTELKINDCPNILALSGVEKCQKLSHLTCDGGYVHFHLHELAQLPELKTLVFRTDYEPDSLCQLQHLTHLTLERVNGIDNLLMLEALNNLTSLEISNCNALSDSFPIAKLPALTTLYIHNCDALTSLCGIDSLTNLESLTVTNEEDHLTNLSSVWNLKKLTYLNLRDNTTIIKLNGIEKLTALKTLKIHRVYITDLQFLQKLTQITKLELTYMFELKDFRGIELMQNLTDLDVDWFDYPFNMHSIDNLSHLTHLRLGCNESISNLTGINKLKNLHFMSLSFRDQYSLSELSGLPVLDSLELEFLDRRPLDTIGPFPSLKYMKLKGATSIVGIANLPTITTLDIDAEYLNDLSGIEKLPALQTLSAVDYFKYRNYDAFYALKNLRQLYISEKQKVDIKRIIDKNPGIKIYRHP